MSAETFSLDSLRIATPCRADWTQMTGDDRVRACGLCKKNVYDLSTLTRAEAERVVASRDGRVCVRLWRRRADGRVLTADCPVGLAARLRRRASRVAAAILAFLGFAAGVSAVSARDDGATTFEQLIDGRPPCDIEMGGAG